MAGHRPISVDFTLGSRRLFGVQRQLCDVSFSLKDLLLEDRAALPAIGPDCDGYRIMSAPQTEAEAMAAHAGYICGAFQNFRRHYIEMTGSFEDYLSGFSAKTRATLRRKQRKLDADAGAPVAVREYRSPQEIEQFLDLALPLSSLTYQARLLDAGLPQDQPFREQARDLAGSDRLRAYLLFIGDRPASYLYLPIENQVVVYAHVGFDPRLGALSPGTMLQMEALERLFDEGRYRHFDFTEGEGGHKALFGTASVACSSFLMLRRNVSNRLLLGSRAAFDRAATGSRQLAQVSGALPKLRSLLRA